MVFGRSRDKLLLDLDVAAARGRLPVLRRLIREAELAHYTDECPELVRARAALEQAQRRRDAVIGLKVCLASVMRRRRGVALQEIKDWHAQLMTALGEAQQCKVGQELWETAVTLLRRLEEEMVALQSRTARRIEGKLREEKKRERLGKLREAPRRVAMTEPESSDSKMSSQTSDGETSAGHEDIERMRSMRSGRSAKPEVSKASKGSGRMARHIRETGAGEPDCLQAVEATSPVLTLVVQRCTSAKVRKDVAQDTWASIGRGLIVYVSVKPGELDGDTVTPLMLKVQHEKVLQEAAESLLTARFCAGQSAWGSESVVEASMRRARRDILLVPQPTLISGMKLGSSTVFYKEQAKQQQASEMFTHFVEVLTATATKICQERFEASRPKPILRKKGESEAQGGEQADTEMSEEELHSATTRKVIDGIYTNFAFSESEETQEAAVKIQARFRGNMACKKKAQIVEDQELTDAATKIQARYRGINVRRNRFEKQEDSGEVAKRDAAALYPRSKAREKAAKNQVRFHEGTEEEHAAATKIQARFRGKLARKGTGFERPPTDTKSEEDEEAEQAAMKIQARFRGNRTRKGLQKGNAGADAAMERETQDKQGKGDDKNDQQEEKQKEKKKPFTPQTAVIPVVQCGKFGCHQQLQMSTDEPATHTFTFVL